VGRIRYLGVVLYDADRVFEAASVANPQELYQAQLDVFLDPRDPDVILAAREAGINDAWIESAQNSPVYKLAMDWRVALPLHPEYRTLPMVWYVPSLSPIMNHLAHEEQMSGQAYLAAVDQMRIPMAYLASLLTAGDVGLIRDVLVRLVAMRMHMRQRSVGDVDDTTLLQESGMTARDLEDMARLLGVAKYDERFVIPTARREDVPDPVYLQGACGLEGIAPPEGIWPQSRINRARERERE
jgi:nitrate reductase beta subunit